MLQPEQTLRESEAMLRSLFEYAPDSIVVVNGYGLITRINTRSETMFGYSRAELLGQPLEILLPQRFRGRHIHHRLNYMAESRLRPMGAGLELFAQHKDGREIPVDIMLSPFKVSEGDMVIAVVRDITERKRFEQTLREKNIELENANQAKDRFLASMSHELRTPLNAIIGFTGTLLMKLPGPLTSDQDKQLRTIQASAKHLLSLINDLLDLTKIESGNVDLHPEPVVCQHVIQEVVTTLRPLAQSKHLPLEVETPPQELVIRTDRRALRQILINLTNNAIKFTEKGRVRLELTERQFNEHKETVFCLMDTGIGIRPEDQAKLFQAFAQVDSSATRRYEGTGLGLHLSQKLADLLGGHIEVESEFGRGSRFTLVIPEK